MSGYILKKEDFGKFIESLKEEYEIFAPVKKKTYFVFGKVDSAEEIAFEFINTEYSPTNLFFPKKEVLFDYNNTKINNKKEDITRVIFGIRPCDVHALIIMDTLFLEANFEDTYYRKKRENTLLISLKCNSAGENCFCESMGTDKLERGYDLMFCEQGGSYVVDIGSQRGQKLINELFKSTDEECIKELHCNKKLDMQKVNQLEQFAEHEGWKKESEACLSCAACTITCPTCGCFDVVDVPNLNMAAGKRLRVNTSCQLKNFSEVAGGHVFRETRDKRFKHRIYHKLVYFKKQFDTFMCVGCGRCITNCPAGIDMVSIINSLK
ncbi:4Fe-4S dicluster domain-containing protein [Candidatus Woesearchaeota archaeon]|nr:4Fe-4S dicluster domain-containing protein [Candidatus Woesearchaeota archaeon]